MSSISIEWLAQLPYEEQEKVLSRLAKIDDLCPIEINGKKTLNLALVEQINAPFWAKKKANQKT